MVAVATLVAVGLTAALVVYAWGESALRAFAPLRTSSGIVRAERPKGASASTVPTVNATTTPTAKTQVAKPLGREIVIGWVGDLTPGSKYGNPPRGGRALFEPTREFTLKPDIMVANLEGTFGKGGTSKCAGRDSSVCFAFQAPPKNAGSLAWAGFDVVNLANNHSRDYLGAGLKSTRKALKDNDISYTGLTDKPIAYKEVDGVRVAFVGFSPYAWSPSIGDIAGAEALVRKADRNADVVVVIIHAGAEGADKTRTPKGAETAFGEFRGNPRKFSRAVIDAGADLVVGSGPHVIRGMERYKGRLIAYSLGNFAGYRVFALGGPLSLSGILRVTLRGDGAFESGTLVPTRMVGAGVPALDPAESAHGIVRTLSKEDFGARAVKVSSSGALSR